jgi:uncharacterized protein YbjT (DUF2867 family)
MKVILFGATGMVGQGVLRECLLAPDVEQVLAVGRSSTGQVNPKLREVKHTNFTSFTAIESELRGFDACFFCLGVSSAGMSEADYAKLTYDTTLAAAELIARLNPSSVFTYVSGVGTDSSEKGRSMWARVKGKTENALLRLPFRAAYMFRPGVIQALHGIRSKTRLYQVFYSLLGWWGIPVARALFPNQVTTTERVGRAMLEVVRRAPEQRVLEPRDINALGSSA